MATISLDLSRHFDLTEHQALERRKSGHHVDRCLSTPLMGGATAPVGLSIREMCRQHYGWHRSRSELYRRSRNGAERVAMALQRDGVPVPAGLLEVNRARAISR